MIDEQSGAQVLTERQDEVKSARISKEISEEELMKSSHESNAKPP